MKGGTVRWFNPAKGYGLIARDSGGDVLVDGRALQYARIATLHEGERVVFTVIMGERGLQAETLRAEAGPIG